MSEQREQFRRRVEELVARFEGEVDRREWVTRRYPKRLRDDARQVYEVPALYLQKGPTSLLLDPIGYDVPGAEGAADLYLMPTYDPTASLYFEDGQWVIHYAFPPDPIGDALRDRDPGLAPLRRDDQPGPQLDRRTCRTVGLTGTNTSRRSGASTGPHGPPSTG